MKRTVLTIVAAAAFGAAATVSAQVVERVWDDGTVWTIGKVDIKPGQYNAYMKYFKEVTIPRLEYGRRSGDIVSWKVMSVMNPRHGEPDVLVLTEFKNMAAFDRGPAFGEEMSRKLAGSLQARQAQQVQLRELAEPMGSVMAREVRIIR